LRVPLHGLRPIRLSWFQSNWPYPFRSGSCGLRREPFLPATAGFTLRLHILSATLPTRCRPKSGGHACNPV
jgi:hypothetical protein